jgi:hypothetical protein
MAKRGRPKTEEPREVLIGIRVTSEERDLIEKYCRLKGMSKRDLLLESILLPNNELEIILPNNTEEIKIKIRKQ